MTIKDTEERKTLEKRIASLWAEHRSKADEIGGIERQMSLIEKQARSLEIRLEALKPKGISVSDHAIVRYLERKAGVDVKAIRDEILSPTLTSAVAALGGSGKFPVNGFTVILKDYTVTTITGSGC